MPITVRHPQAVPPSHVVGEALRPLVTHASGSRVEVLDTRGPKDCGPPPHRHPWDEIYVVLEGELMVVSPGCEPVTVPAGSTVHVPANTVHAYKILSNTAHFLTIVSKGRASDFFDTAARSVCMDPLDVPALIATGAAHDIEFVL